MKRMALVIRDDAYDRLYTPLTFADVAAQQNVEIDILFGLWAVRVLTEQGAKAVKIDGRHAAEEEGFKDRLRRDGDPLAIPDFIRLVKRTGNVRSTGGSHIRGGRVGAHPRGGWHCGLARVPGTEGDQGRSLSVFLMGPSNPGQGAVAFNTPPTSV